MKRKYYEEGPPSSQVETGPFLLEERFVSAERGADCYGWEGDIATLPFTHLQVKGRVFGAYSHPVTRNLKPLLGWEGRQFVGSATVCTDGYLTLGVSYYSTKRCTYCAYFQIPGVYPELIRVPENDHRGDLIAEALRCAAILPSIRAWEKAYPAIFAGMEAEYVSMITEEDGRNAHIWNAMRAAKSDREWSEKSRKEGYLELALRRANCAAEMESAIALCGL